MAYRRRSPSGVQNVPTNRQHDQPQGKLSNGQDNKYCDTHLNKTCVFQTLIELGKRLEPGSDDSHFCKPTSVAVLPSGEFFVADGYCNSRIIKFNNMGRRIAEWGEKPASGFFGRKPSLTELNLPHSITLVPDKDMVCVADRENGRIMCFSTTDGQFRTELKFPEFGSSVYAVAYSGPSDLNKYFFLPVLQ